MYKSLLRLLKEEDKLSYDVKLYGESYEEAKTKGYDRIAPDYKESQEKAEQDLLSCRKEISRYLDFLEALREE